MNKFLIAVAACLSSLVMGEDDAIISMSSSSDESESADDEYGAFNGFGVKVYDNDGSPELVVYNEYDSSGNVYCLSFEGTFEASSYNSSNCDYEDVDDSEVDFGDLDWTYSTCENATDECDFTFYASSDRFDQVKFTFYLIQAIIGLMLHHKILWY